MAERANADFLRRDPLLGLNEKYGTILYGCGSSARTTARRPRQQGGPVPGGGRAGGIAGFVARLAAAGMRSTVRELQRCEPTERQAGRAQSEMEK
jgi:hypothetical protein